MLRSRRLGIASTEPRTSPTLSIGALRGMKGIASGILLVALLSPMLARADCTKLIDKHLEYYKGIKDHLDSRQSFDPGIKKIPYDVKIIDNHAQDYGLLSRNESFFYPNTADSVSDFGFGGDDPNSGYIPALCIIQTPDGSKWVVWRDEIRLWFYNEEEQKLLN